MLRVHVDDDARKRVPLVRFNPMILVIPLGVGPLPREVQRRVAEAAARRESKQRRGAANFAFVVVRTVLLFGAILIPLIMAATSPFPLLPWWMAGASMIVCIFLALAISAPIAPWGLSAEQ